MTEEHCPHVFERFRRWPVKDRWRCVRLDCGFVTRAYDSVDAAAGRPVHPHMSVAVPGFNTINSPTWTPYGWWMERSIERDARRLLHALQSEAFLRPDDPWMTGKLAADVALMRHGTQYAGLARLEARGAIERREQPVGSPLYRYVPGGRQP